MLAMHEEAGMLSVSHVHIEQNPEVSHAMPCNANYIGCNGMSTSTLSATLQQEVPCDLSGVHVFVRQTAMQVCGKPSGKQCTKQFPAESQAMKYVRAPVHARILQQYHGFFVSRKG